jgi:hypothetical protein
LVFIDETGVNTKMTRLYGRAPRGQRLKAKAPFGHWKTITFVAALRLIGVTAPWVLDGAMDGPAYRNVFSHVPAPKVREVANMLRAIHAQESHEAAAKKAEEVIAKLKAMRLAKAAELVETNISETFSFYAFPDQHWIKLKTNNPLERIMREIRRRTRVVGAFPDGQSALNLAAARLRHIAGTRWSTKRYMNINLLKQQRMTA